MRTDNRCPECQSSEYLIVIDLTREQRVICRHCFTEYVVYKQRPRWNNEDAL